MSLPLSPFDVFKLFCEQRYALLLDTPDRLQLFDLFRQQAYVRILDLHLVSGV